MQNPPVIYRVLFILLSTVSITLYMYSQKTLSGEEHFLWSILLGSTLASLLIGAEYLMRRLHPRSILSLLAGLSAGYGIGKIFCLFFNALFAKGPIAAALQPQTLYILDVSCFILGAYVGAIGIDKLLDILPLDVVFSRLNLPITKPPLQAGETSKIKIQRSGKEPKQGIGYLDDGTMVVVNGGGDFLGETIPIYVLSIKQTASGRIIFCNACDSTYLCQEGPRL